LKQVSQKLTENKKNKKECIYLIIRSIKIGI